VLLDFLFLIPRARGDCSIVNPTSGEGPPLLDPSLSSGVSTRRSVLTFRGWVVCLQSLRLRAFPPISGPVRLPPSRKSGYATALATSSGVFLGFAPQGCTSVFFSSSKTDRFFQKLLAVLSRCTRVHPFLWSLYFLLPERPWLPGRLFGPSSTPPLVS